MTEIAAAAALATIELVGHDNAAPGGPWRESIDTWQREGKIRKIVRRARGAAWERAQRPSGVTVKLGSAEVRAFLPSPTDDIAPEIDALQIRSSDLPAPPVVASLEDVPGPTAERGMIVAISPDVELTWGKAAAQAAHAAQILWRDAAAGDIQTWMAAGRSIVVIHPEQALWSDLLASGAAQVRDGGYTEVAPNTLTACALWHPVTGM